MSASERKIAELEAENDRLRKLLGQSMRTGEEIVFTAIVNSDGEPKLDIRWDELASQCSTDEGREMALQLLRVCEWADLDATVFLALRDDLGDGAAAGFMALMRQKRGAGSYGSASSRPEAQST